MGQSLSTNGGLQASLSVYKLELNSIRALLMPINVFSFLNFFPLYNQPIIVLYLLWAVASLWKTLVFLSPSFNHKALDFCLHHSSSCLIKASNSTSIVALTINSSCASSLSSCILSGPDNSSSNLAFLLASSARVS